MGLALWRYAEEGLQQVRGQFDIRPGRRQNAILGTREPIVNSILNPFFLHDADHWAADAGLIVVSRPIQAPFGFGAVELVVVDAQVRYLTQQHSPADSSMSKGLINPIAPLDPNYKGILSVYAKGRAGTPVLLRYKQLLNEEYIVTRTLTKDDEWERLEAEFMPGVINNDNVDVWTVEVSFGIDATDNQTRGPVYLAAAQFCWSVQHSQPFVYEDLGSVRGEPDSIWWNETTGGGTAYYTMARVPTPHDILRPVGAVAFWQYFDALYSGKNFLFKFKRGHGGVPNANGYNTSYDVFGAWVDGDTLVVQTVEAGGFDLGTETFSLTGVTLEKNWHHFVIQWDGTQFISYHNGVRLRRTAETGNRYFQQVPGLLLFQSNGEVDGLYQTVGLQEGFAIYGNALSRTDVEYLYRSGDNLTTGVIGYVSAHDDLTLETGTCIGFEGPGDFRVEVGGYAPGASEGQPTVRFESGREASGPYIVQARFPKVVEPITFNIGNQSRPDMTVAQKLGIVNTVLQRSGTQQNLILQYAPQGSQRNVRAEVTTAHMTIPPEWTGIAQTVNILKGVKIDLERQPHFTGGWRQLGRIELPRPHPDGDPDANYLDEYGTISFPPVEGNVDAPMSLLALHSLYENGTEVSQPTSWMLALRRLNSPIAPVYAFPASFSSGFAADDSRFSGWYTPVDLTADTPGEWRTIRTYDSASLESSDYVSLDALDSVSNEGNYRVYAWVRTATPEAGVSARVSIGSSVGTATVPDFGTGVWGMVDMGVINIPGIATHRPRHGWMNRVIISVGAMKNADVAAGIDFGGLIFMPVDDGILQVYTQYAGTGTYTYADADGDISNPDLVAGFGAGLYLSTTLPSEVRAFGMQHHIGTPSGDAWDIADHTMRLVVRYMPTYSGLGDD